MKETSVEIAGALADIFKMSVSTGEVPDDWRIAHVVPLFKKGSKSNAGNYRPVSLTSVVGKLLEAVVKGLLTAIKMVPLFRKWVMLKITMFLITESPVYSFQESRE